MINHSGFIAMLHCAGLNDINRLQYVFVYDASCNRVTKQESACFDSLGVNLNTEGLRQIKYAPEEYAEADRRKYDREEKWRAHISGKQTRSGEKGTKQA